jgi:hypothetical protein
LYYRVNSGIVSVGIAPDGSTTGRPTPAFTGTFGQSDPLGKDYTVAPDGRLLLVEPSERRPSVSHLHVIVNWPELLRPANPRS